MSDSYGNDGERHEAVFGEETLAGVSGGVKVKNFSFRATFGDDRYGQKEEAFYEELNTFLDEHEWYDIRIESRPFGADTTMFKYHVMVKEAHVFYREEDME